MSITIIEPSSINIELTNVCNLKCTTCPRSYKDIDVGCMKLEDVMLIIDNLNDKVNLICLSVFGEIFTYPHLLEAVHYIKNKKSAISIMITTNATLPNTHLIYNNVIDYIDKLTISIDGIGDTYNLIRKKANYDDVINNIDKISEVAKRRGKSIGINMVVIEDNYRQMTDIVKLASKYHFKVRFSPLNIASLPEDQFDTSFYYFYLSDNFRSSLNEALELAGQLGVSVESAAFLNLSDFKSVKDCVFLRDGFTISWNGNVPLCCNTSLTNHNFGNVFDSGLMNCINSDEFNTIRDYINKGIISRYCERCGDYNQDNIIAGFTKNKQQ